MAKVQYRSTGILMAALIGVSSLAQASEPLHILENGKTVSSSVSAELVYFTGNDRPVMNVNEIEKLGGLNGSSIMHDAWSDSYWNDIQGGIASPYNDSSALGTFLPFGTFAVLSNRDKFFDKHGSRWSAVESLSEDEISKLSPAEKYDLLVGDQNFTLSRMVWEKIAFLHENRPKLKENGSFVFDDKGQMVYEPKKTGITPFWQGICNGWASAALNLERPLHSFTITNARGQRIKFYPADVRALASQLWARSGINSAYDRPGPGALPVIRHSGYRCNDGHIKRDFWSRRPKNPACNDVNPGV